MEVQRRFSVHLEEVISIEKVFFATKKVIKFYTKSDLRISIEPARSDQRKKIPTLEAPTPSTVQQQGVEKVNSKRERSYLLGRGLARWSKKFNSTHTS